MKRKGSGSSKRFPARPQAKSKPEAYQFSPSHPELLRQLFTREGYVEDFDEPRMKLEAVFSCR